MNGTKDYLGDSVYAEFDGYGIVLTTENGEGPSNRIVLEPQVLESLNRYVERLMPKPHTHVNNQKDDACAVCGHDLRHPVHRSPNAPGEPRRKEKI